MGSEAFHPRCGGRVGRYKRWAFIIACNVRDSHLASTELTAPTDRGHGRRRSWQGRTREEDLKPILLILNGRAAPDLTAVNLAKTLDIDVQIFTSTAAAKGWIEGNEGQFGLSRAFFSRSSYLLIFSYVEES